MKPRRKARITGLDLDFLARKETWETAIRMVEWGTVETHVCLLEDAGPDRKLEVLHDRVILKCSNRKDLTARMRGCLARLIAERGRK